MMDFVRRLAPARDDRGGHAVPLLSSRIARPMPIRAPLLARLGDDPDPVDTEIGQAAPAGTDTERRLSAARQAFESTTHAEALDRTLSRPPVAAVAGVAPEARSLRPAEATATASRPLATMPTPRIGPVESRPTPIGTPERSSALRGDAPTPSRAAPVQDRVAAAIGRPVRPDPSAPRRPTPLTAATLAARVPPAATAPTVVHVNIDRIDLRLPASTAAPARPPQRARAGSVALADYLSSRKPGGNGASR